MTDTTTTPCHCENATGDCDHGGAGKDLLPCPRPAGKGAEAEIGPLCDHCCTVMLGYGRYSMLDTDGNPVDPPGSA